MLGCLETTALGIVARRLLLSQDEEGDRAVKRWRKAPSETRNVASRHPKSMMGLVEKPRAARVSFRSVFEVGGARLAIGHFNRPLADEEYRTLKRAFEGARLPEVEDFEVSAKRVSFLTPPPRVDAIWRSIEALLATLSLAKAS
jgi:hypothetical protein